MKKCILLVFFFLLLLSTGILADEFNILAYGNLIYESNNIFTGEGGFDFNYMISKNLTTGAKIGVAVRLSNSYVSEFAAIDTLIDATYIIPIEGIPLNMKANVGVGYTSSFFHGSGVLLEGNVGLVYPISKSLNIGGSVTLEVRNYSIPILLAGVSINFCRRSSAEEFAKFIEDTINSILNVFTYR